MVAHKRCRPLTCYNSDVLGRPHPIHLPRSHASIQLFLPPSSTAFASWACTSTASWSIDRLLNLGLTDIWLVIRTIKVRVYTWQLQCLTEGLSSKLQDGVRQGMLALYLKSRCELHHLPD